MALSCSSPATRNVPAENVAVTAGSTRHTKEAALASLQSIVMTMRSQVALYKLQHNDYLPGQLALVGTGGTFDSTVFWNQMTQFSDVTGAVSTAKTAQYDKGPYMQSLPKNPLCPTTASSSLTEATVNGAKASGVVGFIYDYQGGAGSGKIWGTDTDGLTAVPQ